MGTHAVERAHRLRLHVPAAARAQLSWLAAGLAVGFLVPFVFADRLELPRDLYYAVHIGAVLAFVALWARRTGQDLPALARRRVPLTLALGLAAAGVLALVVLSTEDATARPDGLELVAAVLWRGVAYGAADGLLLSVFPILAVFALFAGTRARRGVAGTLAVGLAALAASLAMTAVYHLGYAEFRSEQVRQPLAGDVVWSAPTLLTLNPVGAPVAHAGMHVAAVLHSYETDVFLPPHE
ncbi:MAG TPA: hypothetical protein VD704_13580 [Gaiellaceae bacterium]|nr:hypothetical protein [Gaiellaceae bacterium]